MRTVEEIKQKIKELQKEFDKEISTIENCYPRNELGEFIGNPYVKADEINLNIKLLEWVLGE